MDQHEGASPDFFHMICSVQKGGGIRFFHIALGVVNKYISPLSDQLR